MARMPLSAAAAVGGHQHLFDLWATAPSAGNWQEPMGQDSSFFPLWSTWSRETKNGVLFLAYFLVLLLVCICVNRLFCRNKKNAEQDTSRIVVGPWSNNDEGEGVSAPLPPAQQEEQPLPAAQQEEQPLPASGDGHGPWSINIEEGDRHPRRQPPPTVVQVPTADVELAVGDVQLTQADMEWMMANLELLAPAANVDMAPLVDEEIEPAPEPAPTLKFTFSTAEGWEEGICTVCLSDLVNGQKVRLLTGCMHCFHAICIEKWLRRNATCPTCRVPAMAVPARGRHRRQTVDPNLSIA